MNETAVRTGVGRWVPVAAWLPRYRRSDLPADLLAGTVVAALAVPQSLGYAGIAGVPVQVGLYAIPLALVAYAIFGSSPHLVVGPVSTVAVLSGSLVADLSGGDPGSAVAFTSALAIGAGLGLLIGGLARIGWAAEFLSRPIVTGFVFGLSILIILGEIPSLLGMPVESGDVLTRAWSIATHLVDLDPATAAIGLAALAVLFIGARFAPRVPWALIVLIVGIGASSWLDLAAQGVVTVGDVPSGLPPIGLPDISVTDIPPVLVGSLALALVGLAEGLSAARLFAAREGYTVDANQELLATGAANVAAGLSGGLGVAGSLSKTAASRRTGGVSQLTGITTAVLVLLVLVALANLLSPLPRAVLSAIVIQAVWGLMDVSALRRYKADSAQRLRRLDGRHGRRAPLRSALRAAPRRRPGGARPRLPVQPRGHGRHGQGARREGRLGQRDPPPGAQDHRRDPGAAARRTAVLGQRRRSDVPGARGGGGRSGRARSCCSTSRPPASWTPRASTRLS